MASPPQSITRVVSLSAEKNQRFRQRYKRMQQLIRSRRLMERFSGCMNCLVFQKWCDRWERIETKKKNRGDWKKSNEIGSCQFDETVMNEFVMMEKEKNYSPWKASINRLLISSFVRGTTFPKIHPASPWPQSRFKIFPTRRNPKRYHDERFDENTANVI